MSDIEILCAISGALRTGFQNQYTDAVAAELGLTWDRWFVSRYAGNPAIAAPAMADFLDGLVNRLVKENVQVALAQLVGLDEPLADKADQLCCSGRCERIVVGDGVEDFSSDILVVQVDR